MATDDRFYTPRSSARRGYPSADDDRFVSSRESARSVSSVSDDNEYVTPRESVVASTAYESPRPVAAGGATATAAHHSSKYLADAFRGSQRTLVATAVSDAKQTPSSSSREAKSTSKANDRYLGLATNGTNSSNIELRAAQFADAPDALENDIFSAARHNRVDSVTYMLDHGGVSVNSKDAFGNTILSIACQNGLKRMAKLALRRGANINSKNLRGNTALHFCFAYGYGDSLGAYLISKGADTTIMNKYGGVCYAGIDQQQPSSARK